jgi:osmoprotectant transport system ATP-binding protein
MPPHLRVTNLICELGGIRIINQASFDIKQGETFVLLGHQGSGKTTLLKMLNRIREPSSGQIEMEGVNILELSKEPLRRTIAYLGKKSCLFPHKTIEENISILPKLLGWSRKTTRNRMDELLAVMGLDSQGILAKYPQDLTPEECSRVGIIRSLAGKPKLIILDEPFASLSPMDCSRLKQEFFSLAEVKGSTIILATANRLEAIERGDQISVIDRGVIRSIGTSIDLLFTPRNQFISQFFQDERFQLELAALKLGDILEVLPIHTGIYDTEKVEAISFRATLLDILKRSESSSDGWGRFLVDCEDGVRRWVERKDLLKGFHDIRGHLCSGRPIAEEESDLVTDEESL